jgi:hypothetical protein
MEITVCAAVTESTTYHIEGGWEGITMRTLDIG